MQATVNQSPPTAASQPTAQPARFSLSCVLALVFVLVTLSPFAKLMGKGLWTAWLIFPIWLMLALIERKGTVGRVLREAKRRTFELVMLAAWLMVVAANVALGRGFAGVNHLQIMLTMAMVVTIDLVYSARDDGSYSYLSKGALFVLGLDVLRSLPVLWSSPHVARDVTGGIGWASAAEVAKYGVGDYNLYTGLAIALPVVWVLGLTAKRAGQRLALNLITSAFGIAVILSMFTGASLLLAVGFALMGLLHFRTTPQKMRSFGILIVLVTALVTLWVLYLGGTTQGSYVSDKFWSYYNSIMGGGLGSGVSAYRTLLYKLSIDTFLKYPLFGIGPTSGVASPFYLTLIGGHSSWFDLPAEYGILGFVFYVLFLGAGIYRTVRASRDATLPWLGPARLASCVLFLVGGTYNPVVTNPEILVLFHLIVLGGIRTGTAPIGLPSPLGARSS